MSTTTFADGLAAGLRDAVAATTASVGSAGRSFTRAVQAVSQATDVVDVMRAAVDVVVASEALHRAAIAAETAARASLAAAMESSGATTIAAEHQTAHLARKPAFLSINDGSLIPREFYVQPPPKLDERAVKSALKDGQEVPGVSLAIPNAMSLVIRARKEQP